MQIISGLNNLSLVRLKGLIKAVPQNYRETLSRLEQTMSPAQNSKNYRNLVKQQPSIPFLGKIDNSFFFFFSKNKINFLILSF
jgi:hypothetical protein